MNVRDWIHQPLLDERFPLPLRHPFTTQQALATGLTYRQLAALVQAGLLRKPVKAVYLATQAGDSPRLRAECIHLVVPHGAVVCDRHAGWLHGAQMVLAPGEHLELRPVSVFRLRGLGRLRNDLCASGERDLGPDDIVDFEGLLVTSALRTAWDLGRQRWRDPAIAGLDAMLRLGEFSHDELLAGVERFRGARWVRTLRDVAPLADGRSASPGESVLRLRWIDCGLPRPEPQTEVWVDGSLIAVLDLGEPETRYAAEYDGAQWHSSPEQQIHDRRRRAAAAEERWTIDAFVAADTFGLHRTVDHRLRAGLVRARLALGRRTYL